MDLRGSDMKLRSGVVKSNSVLSSFVCQLHPSSSSLLADEKKKEQREQRRFFQSLKQANVVCAISSDDEVYLPLSHEKEQQVKKNKFIRRKPCRTLFTRGPRTPGILTAVGLTDGESESSDSPDDRWRSRPL
jgi:hypothetical protein